MIAAVRGEVLSSGAGWVVVQPGAGSAGVGLRIEVPARLAAARPGESIALHTHLVVREDALTLFGFPTAPELEVFAILLSVSGVGPRSALGVLSELTPVQIATAAAAEDEAPFRRVSGIGPKTAKLIAVQLRGKLDPRAFAGDATSADPASGDAGDGERVDLAAQLLVTQALVGLGYAEGPAEIAVRDALVAGASASEAPLLRAALALLQTPRLPGASPRTGGR